jgi:hypothetical protein
MGVHLATEGRDVIPLHVEDGSAVRVLDPVTEEEVLTAFVYVERDSSRYGECIRTLLEKHGGDVRAVLEEHRAWERRDGLFGGFPRDVTWFRAFLTEDVRLTRTRSSRTTSRMKWRSISASRRAWRSGASTR